MVSSAADCVVQPSGLSRRLALPVREIIARLMLRITVLATIVRLTDRPIRRVITDRAIVRHLNHPGPLHPGRRVNRIGRVDHRSRPGRNGRARAALRSLVKRDPHVRINLDPQGLRLRQNLEVRAAHRHSRGSVNNQGRNPDSTRVNRSKDTSGSADSLMAPKKKARLS
jgi:hypothetical protein